MSAYINTLLDHAAYYLNGPLFMGFLLGTGLFFTIYLRFPQVRYFRKAFRLLLGKEKSTDGAGQTSVFQALATSLASSIGAGSISGVAFAIHIGGPAVMFWMWVNALLGMATRMAGTAASHRYRCQRGGGEMVGGPMYFMEKGLKMPGLGVLFAVGTLFSTFLAGNLPQVNGMTKMIHVQWGMDKVVAGSLITFLVGIVVLGGIQRISQVAELMVPFMGLFYLALVLFVVGMRWDRVLPALERMCMNPFRTAPVVGGFLGSSFAQVMHQGVNYGFFTNDAGTGAATIVHCASKEQVTGKVAIMSMIEPFLSTCVMCTLTALAIVTTGSFHTKVLHDFDRIDIEVLAGDHGKDVTRLHEHVLGRDKLPVFTGELAVADGKIQNRDVTFLHDRSLAEEVCITLHRAHFSGVLSIVNGHIEGLDHDVVIRGKSLLKDADLALYTFGANPWGGFATFWMILCFLLFAFSTIVSYGYFGGRALVYLGGRKYLVAYRLLFVTSVFIGSVMEATLVWKAAILSCAMMAIPNLLGILMMRREIKASVEAVG